MLSWEYSLVGAVLLLSFTVFWSKLSKKTSSPIVRGDVLLVFAHPDDEAMFFAPLLTCLMRMNVRVHFLCLSNGNFAGLGRVREKELRASGAYFRAASVKVLDEPLFQDGMSYEWDPTAVAKAVRQSLDTIGTIRTVVTFDALGVSRHPNHIAVHRGVAHLKRTSPPGIMFLQLASVSLMLKYSGPLSLVWQGMTLKVPSNLPTKFVVVVRPEDALQSYWGMSCHRSQFVWFRYLFVFFSSYTFANQFSEINH